ncbi:D-glycero-D-manno-heptose 1-phosphate guanosyltransferase [Campylobacter sp. MIT 97-5078]|uniref:D-glycero-D-manno-heptose 1-phosphate guanosyltransferase n=1 Tax=Campylobacter sp. MIT 97-5078 TaxID=1548153 RepID=UPI000512CC13|nr:nucleotidyltransferase family protein [Campylobacter sp. MIT 97-5078]KGI55287.1 D-glycero-D-manno-heptose 1-phosphate guanosyltransferase [Campylobacter sp. MIT 97-5078]TQR27670.1 D-glycero-D-manno-heptose 1-phosphate guanosyltransferase [Campylobacter sp. MIT 97-5078]
MEAIVLCGGLGTRLRSVVKDIPKPMADINGKPFLSFVLEYLKAQGVQKLILAVSYKYELIQEYFKDEFLGLKLTYSIEKEALGTGGAIKQALSLAKEKEQFVLNGDSFFDINLSQLRLENQSKLCLALKKMNDFERYGVVELDDKGLVSSFKEKAYFKHGLINAGIYLLDKTIFDAFSLEKSFSFEDFMQSHFKALRARAEVFDGYFIDIGVPQDYFKASQYFK